MGPSRRRSRPGRSQHQMQAISSPGQVSVDSVAGGRGVVLDGGQDLVLDEIPRDDEVLQTGVGEDLPFGLYGDGPTGTRLSGSRSRCPMRPLCMSWARYGVFLGLDIGRIDHHAVALDPAGKRLDDAALPNTRGWLQKLFDSSPGIVEAGRGRPTCPDRYPARRGR
jgi:hypothetical protein